MSEKSQRVKDSDRDLGKTRADFSVLLKSLLLFFHFFHQDKRQKESLKPKIVVRQEQ